MGCYEILNSARCAPALPLQKCNWKFHLIILNGVTKRAGTEADRDFFHKKAGKLNSSDIKKAPKGSEVSFDLIGKNFEGFRETSSMKLGGDPGPPRSKGHLQPLGTLRY